MERMVKTSLLVFLPTLLLLAAACTVLPAGQAPGSPELVTTAGPDLQLTASAIPNPTKGEPGTFDSLVSRTLALRGIELNLTTTQAGGEQASLSGEIDANGNQHLLKTYPANPTLPLGEGVTDPLSQQEIYVLDGVAYVADINGILQPAQTASLASTLPDALLSHDGPVYWLNMLPSGSLVPQDSETYGGFQATRYTIQGVVDNQEISGTIWLMQDGSALLGAQLNVPADLTGSLQTHGSLEISFSVEQASIAPIQPAMVPSLITEAPFIVQSTEPITGTPSTSEPPIELFVYPGSQVQTGRPGMVVYRTADKVELVEQHYQA